MCELLPGVIGLASDLILGLALDCWMIYGCDKSPKSGLIPVILGTVGIVIWFFHILPEPGFKFSTTSFNWSLILALLSLSTCLSK